MQNEDDEKKWNELSAGYRKSAEDLLKPLVNHLVKVLEKELNKEDF